MVQTEQKPEFAHAYYLGIKTSTCFNNYAIIEKKKESSKLGLYKINATARLEKKTNF